MLAHFDQTHFMGDALGDRRVVGIFGDVAFDAIVIGGAIAFAESRIRKETIAA